MKKSYLIDKNNNLLAEVSFQKSRDVEYSFTRVEESINANRDWNLVNAYCGKISNAKKWQNQNFRFLAGEIEEGKFYVIKW